MNIHLVIRDFSGGLPERASLITVKSLRFMASVPEHHERIKTILETTGHPNVMVEEFRKRLEVQEDLILEAAKEKPEILIAKPLSGKHLNVIKAFTPLWLFHALYWAYRFDINSDEDILSLYNFRIVDVVLKYLEFYHKMKIKEVQGGDNKHPFSFYEFIATDKARAIEFLVAASRQNSAYLNKLYLDIDKSIDLDMNFFMIQNTNKWESESLQVVKAGSRNVIKYENEDEGLSFQIVSSRMLKDGSLDSFEDAYHKTLQLYALEGANHNSKYRSRLKGASTQSSKRITPVEELDEELIPLVKNPPRSFSKEDTLEQQGFGRQTRREYAKEPTKKKMSKIIKSDNDYARHKRNRAASAKITKNALLLPSDYASPPIKHLGSFIAYALLHLEEEQKTLFALFTLNIMLGSSFEEMMKLLRGEKDSLYSYDDNKLKTKLDSTIFGDRVAEMLDKTRQEITFAIPDLMGMLIAHLKSAISEDIRTDEELFDNMNCLIKRLKKRYPKKIEIKPHKLYAILKAYAKQYTHDLLSSCFATGAYTTADRAKLAYTSTRQSSVTHSSLLNSLWINLGLDNVARKILGLPEGNIFATSALEIPSIKYAGSSSCVKAQDAAKFFSTLRGVFADLPWDSAEAFNIVSIYVRYAMSLLLGTRAFYKSTSFESCSLQEQMMMISEKAETISAGIRVIPICSSIANLLSFYEEHFLRPRSLGRAVWLYKDGKYELFKPKKAYEILDGMPNLENSSFLKQYVHYVPLNSGRHCFTRKALEMGVPTHYISTYLGHYFAGAEQFGIYSTMDITSYKESVIEVNTCIADEFGIKDTLC